MNSIRTYIASLFFLLSACSPQSESRKLDPEALKTACAINAVEVDYFDKDQVASPLAAAFRRGTDVPVSAATVGSNPQPFVAYPEKFSVARGEPLDLRYAGELVRVGDWIARAEIFDAHTHQSRRIVDFSPRKKRIENEPCKSYYKGCDFRRSLKLDTDNLAPGLHYVFLTDDRGAQTTPIYFHVKPTARDIKQADVVVLLSELTWHAYNYYGGGSLYGIMETGPDGKVLVRQNPASRLYAASLRRPLLSDPAQIRPEFDTPMRVEAHFKSPAHANRAELVFAGYDRIGWIRTSPESQLVFSRLLRKDGKTTVTLAQQDLEANPALLAHARVLLVTGHNEYWTDGMIESVRAYLREGGRVANFSGNVMWWRINLADGAIYQDQISHDRSKGCEKRLPPEFRDAGLAFLLEKDSADLLGVNYRFANYPLKNAFSHTPEEFKKVYGGDLDKIDVKAGDGVVVVQPQHPLFRGLNVKAGERLGADTGVVDHEIDGVPLRTDGGIDRNYENTFPEAIRVLATTKAFVASYVPSKDGKDQWFGARDVGIVVEAAPFGEASGARALSFGSIGYAFTLAAGDERFERILLNAIDYLSQPTLPPV